METLLIRADASTSIGIGHAMRCLALAEAWNERGGKIAFASASLSPAVQQRIHAAGWSIERIDAARGSSDDAKQLQAIRDKVQPSWIVMDGYCFEGEYQRQVGGGGCRTLVVDDHGTVGSYAADMVLDQNLGADASDYATAGCQARLLMGSNYVLMRREFRDAARVERIISPIARRVLVTLGGGDPDNAMAKVVEALALVPAGDLSIRLVLGAGHPHEQHIRERVAELPHQTELIASTDRMHELMTWADVAISGGGSTCWELALLQLPSLVVVLAENQRPVAEELATRGFAINLGWHEDVVTADMARQLAALVPDVERRRQMAAAGRSIVDGKGAVRVVEAMLS